MLYFGIYLLIVNLIAFIVWCMDKYFAKAGKRRISEKMLFVWALIGGSIGSLTAMNTVRHKTRHWYFVIGIPLIFVLQCILFVFILKKIG